MRSYIYKNDAAIYYVITQSMGNSIYRTTVYPVIDKTYTSDPHYEVEFNNPVDEVYYCNWIKKFYYHNIMIYKWKRK